MAYLLLGAGQALGLLLTALGWHGVWIQLAALGLYSWHAGFEAIGIVPLGLLFAISLISELLGAIISERPVDVVARRRVGFAALVGGAAGAALGLALPLSGSLFGAVAGALLATAVASFAMRRERVGCGTLLGQVIALGTRSATGIVVAVFILLTLIR